MQDYFVRLPISVLLDNRLTRSSVLLYAVLLDLADENGFLYATIDELADHCRTSPHTVRRSERQLCELGLISIDRTGRASLIGVNAARSMLRQVSGLDTYRHAKRKEG